MTLTYVLTIYLKLSLPLTILPLLSPMLGSL
jgi:hypothetical protein